MKALFSILSILTAAIVVQSIAAAQQQAPGDSTRVFGTLTPHPIVQNARLYNAWGADVLVSTNGFGLGAFYRHEYAEDLAGYVDFSVSEAKDDNEVEYIDPYTFQSYVPNKVNRFLLLPIFVGIQKRMFADDIVDNFRPYINGAVGPTMIYVFPYDQDYFSALGHGSARYTAGGYVGFGAFIGSERSTLFGMDFRYYYVPYPGGIESLENTVKKQFGGFYITFNFGSSW
jgi:hypothetical protein